MGAAARKIEKENFFADSKDLTVTRAEALFTEFLVEHNIPLACADHAGPLFKKCSQIQTLHRSMAVLGPRQHALLKHWPMRMQKRIVKAHQTGPFALAADGSNDPGSVKLYPICVRYFDDEMGKVMCVMLSLKECSTS